MLEYEPLGLRQFLPGAKVKLAERDKLATVADPLRRRRDLFRALLSPVGTPLDKARLLPLFYRVMTKSIDELFEMEETDTLTCLRETYNFKEEFISSFFSPFLEGIYLAPLDQQSSRMFHFVMKMFTVGATSLPRGGMQAVPNQLEDKAKERGVRIQLDARALSIRSDDSAALFAVEVGAKGGATRQLVHAKSIILATDHRVAKDLLQDLTDSLQQRVRSLTNLPQRSVACIYFAFRSPAPILDPILILNGEGSERRNTKDFPINNVCFPSVVQREYAPTGWELCSVTVLEQALAAHGGDLASLEAAVRGQLAAWLLERARDDVRDPSRWVHKGTYVIDAAQPAHYGAEGGANVHVERYLATDPSTREVDAYRRAGNW